MDVPSELLVPPEAYGRSFSPHDAALVLDDWLRRLAGQEAQCRIVLGTLARRFLARRGQHELGFARLGDYAREQLGVSARELQSLATVSARLDGLPRLRDAFVAGLLSWAQLRLLVTVATPETEAEWLESPGAGPSGRLPPSSTHPGRPTTRRRPTTGASGSAVRAGCCSSGSRSSSSPAAWPGASSPTGRPPRRSPPRASRRGRCAGTPGRRPICPRPPPDPAETRAAFADLDWSAVHSAIPEDIARLAGDPDGLDAFAVDARMRDVLRAMRRIDWQLGRLLRVFLDRRLYRLMRFPSAARYLTERLGLSARKARVLVALERKTWEANAFGTAYQAGDISWARALTILPLVTEPTARAWVERATEVPSAASPTRSSGR